MTVAVFDGVNTYRMTTGTVQLSITQQRIMDSFIYSPDVPVNGWDLVDQHNFSDINTVNVHLTHINNKFKEAGLKTRLLIALYAGRGSDGRRVINPEVKITFGQQHLLLPIEKKMLDDLRICAEASGLSMKDWAKNALSEAINKELYETTL